MVMFATQHVFEISQPECNCMPCTLVMHRMRAWHFSLTFQAAVKSTPTQARSHQQGQLQASAQRGPGKLGATVAGAWRKEGADVSRSEAPAHGRDEVARQVEVQESAAGEDELMRGSTAQNGTPLLCEMSGLSLSW